MRITLVKTFDSIIACGDSYTEGHRAVLGIGVDQTWPGKVAKHFDVPYENLAVGGACNLEIALQPMLSQQMQYANPLYIFNFTIDERLLMLNSEPEKVFRTLFSLLEEDTQDIPFSNEYRRIINYFLTKHNSDGLDGFQTHTLRSIQLAHNVMTVNPNASVLWGFIHSDRMGDQDTIFDRGGFDFNNSATVNLPNIETCYNKYVGHKPLQHFIDDNSMIISNQDPHPNFKGIKVLADHMTSIIQNIQNAI